MNGLKAYRQEQLNPSGLKIKYIDIFSWSSSQKLSKLRLESDLFSCSLQLINREIDEEHKWWLLKLKGVLVF